MQAAKWTVTGATRSICLNRMEQKRSWPEMERPSFPHMRFGG
jgi:hypothetical protein